MSDSELVLREQIARDIRSRKTDLRGLSDNALKAATVMNLALEEAAQVAELIPHRSGWVTPDWLIVGAPAEGAHVAGAGVMLLASRDLHGAELIRETVGLDRIPITSNPKGPVARVPRVRTNLVSELGTFDTVYARDYRAAFAELFSRWQPSGSGQPEPGPVALPPSDSV